MRPSPLTSVIRPITGEEIAQPGEPAEPSASADTSDPQAGRDSSTNQPLQQEQQDETNPPCQAPQRRAPRTTTAQASASPASMTRRRLSAELRAARPQASRTDRPATFALAADAWCRIHEDGNQGQNRTAGRLRGPRRGATPAQGKQLRAIASQRPVVPGQVRSERREVVIRRLGFAPEVGQRQV
jgi:hypothetical protein